MRAYLTSDDYKAMIADIAKLNDTGLIMDWLVNWKSQFREHYPLYYNYMLFFLNEIDDFTVTDEIAEKFSKSWFLLSEFEDAPNPSLRYAKVFLEDRVRNADFDEWLDKPIVKIRPSGLAEGFYVESTFHASSPANKENLNLLCEFLKKEKIISVIDNRDFVDAFSNISQEKMDNKITWLVTRSGKNFLKPLYTLIHLLAPEEFDRLPRKKDFYWKIDKNFNFVHSSPNLESIKKSHGEWKEDQTHGVPSTLDPFTTRILDGINEYIKEVEY